MASSSDATKNAVGRGGVAPWRTFILLSIGGLLVVYATLYTIGDHYFALQPAPQYCPEQDTTTTCSRPDLFAFQMTAGLVQVIMGFLGIYAWHVKSSMLPKTPQARIFGKISFGNNKNKNNNHDMGALLNAYILVYQAWDFLVSLTMPEHRSLVFLTHHVLAGATAYFALQHQLVHHYAIFFGACSEISTMFLVLCDLDVYFPAQHVGNDHWATLIFVNQALFTLTFIAYRVIGWWWVSVPLWKDVLHVLPKVADYRPDNPTTTTNFLYVFLTMDVLLGLLQLYWFAFGMVPKIMEILNGGDP